MIKSDSLDTSDPCWVCNKRYVSIRRVITEPDNTQWISDICGVCDMVTDAGLSLIDEGHWPDMVSGDRPWLHHLTNHKLS